MKVNRRVKERKIKYMNLLGKEIVKYDGHDTFKPG